MTSRISLAALLCLGTAIYAPTQASAAFTLFDNFDAYTLGPLSGQGPAGNVWTAQPGATVATQNGNDKAANLLNAIPNYRSLTPAGLSIPNSNAASTVFFDFTLTTGTTGNNFNFVITDDAAPVDTAGSSEVQFNYDATQAPAGGTTTFRARNAGAFVFLSTNGTGTGRLVPQSGFLYNVWFEINNTTDTYQIFMQSPNDSVIATRTLMQSDAGVSTFTFRNSGGGPVANDLITANIGNGGTTTAVQFDNIYVDKAGFNSTNPVPEPSAVALLGGAAVLGLAQRRRK